MRAGVARSAILAGLITLVAIAGAAAADPDNGARLFKRYCAGCHGPDGRGGAHTFMPHVDTLTKKGHVENLTDEYLALAIAGGGLAVRKSAYMPAWGETLSAEEIDDLIAHIRRLPSY